MNINPETDLDLEKLFLPAWAQEPSSTNRYAKFAGGEDKPDRRRDDRRGPRPPRREGPGGGFNRAKRDERPRRDDRRGPPSRDSRGQRAPTFAPRRGERPEHREPPAPLPEVNLTLVPDENGVESLTRQIKMTGRAYPVFDIARLILQKPERCSVRFDVKKNAEGRPVQPLFVCALDETVWLSEDEAVAHVLKHHFATFYQAERAATEPPKGQYTFVAQCGMSGIVLGPPNHHDYQNQLRKLHTERFSKMPFDAYKSRVRIVRDPEVVKKWIEEQSWKTEFACLNVPEPLKLASREEVEKHFRGVHKSNIIRAVETHTIAGVAARALRSPELNRLVRHVQEEQRRFPLQIATVLSQQFAAQGLQFFKVNKTVTHVWVARPHYLDLEATPVSEGVRRIVEFINAHPRCTRRRLVEALAPSGSESRPAAEGTAGGNEPSGGKTADARALESFEPTPEQTAVVSDLHWLVHQGHVIEFANGVLDTAKKPVPKPPKPEAKPAKAKAPPAVEPEPAVVGESPAPVEAPVNEDLPRPFTDAPQPFEASESQAADPAAQETSTGSAPVVSVEPEGASSPATAEAH